MLDWLSKNLGTVLLSLALAAVVAAIIARMGREKKKGKSPCCGDCAHCGMCPHAMQSETNGR
jgi:hypothetical protein